MDASGGQPPANGVQDERRGRFGARVLGALAVLAVVTLSAFGIAELTNIDVRKLDWLGAAIGVGVVGIAFGKEIGEMEGSSWGVAYGNGAVAALVYIVAALVAAAKFGIGADEPSASPDDGRAFVIAAIAASTIGIFLGAKLGERTARRR
jgi:hypothetical protein